tara:strand:- start:19162 stop:19335 length:174 start_codon:yes stop_codon:yes gene_type:complete
MQTIFFDNKDTELSKMYDKTLEELYHDRIARAKDVALGIVAGGCYLLVVGMLVLWRW